MNAAHDKIIRANDLEDYQPFIDRPGDITCEHTGAVVIYGPLGAWTHEVRLIGLGGTREARFGNRRLKRLIFCLALFDYVSPGEYRVEYSSSATTVTVEAGRIVQVDWRIRQDYPRPSADGAASRTS